MTWGAVSVNERTVDGFGKRLATLRVQLRPHTQGRRC